MSKAALKKELAQMDADQLRQIILDAYDARRETKEYFEFFLNPDVDKLLERFEKEIVKELNRTKWGQSKARATKIKTAVKNFRALEPGPEAETNMLFLTLSLLGTAERYLDFTEAQINIARNILTQILELSEKHLMADTIIPRIEGFLRNPGYTTYFRNCLSETVGEFSSR